MMIICMLPYLYLRLLYFLIYLPPIVPTLLFPDLVGGGGGRA
jgi:hypothetical protein